MKLPFHFFLNRLWGRAYEGSLMTGPFRGVAGGLEILSHSARKTSNSVLVFPHNQGIDSPGYTRKKDSSVRLD
jgi:hypothetical protein